MKTQIQEQRRTFTEETTFNGQQKNTAELQCLEYPLGPQKIFRDMGSSSHWGLIMVPGQEANSDNFGVFFYFLHNNCMLSALIRIASIGRF